MAIFCEFIDLIIPISNIDKVYEGGFEKYKSDFIRFFGKTEWHDEFLLRTGAMSPADIQYLVESWEARGLTGVTSADGQKKWKDFCVVESMFGGPTLPCDWIEFDRETRSVHYKGHPEGEIAGPGDRE
ncbi:MAG: hypothetical protein NTU98_09200 [Bacteroidetes bacterium]|nr:hypothetical protein [Bacteroidota bacterium]